MTNPKTVKHLRKRYEKAVADNEEKFTIEGYEFLTKFAKYMLEYIEMRKIHDDIQLRNLLQKVDKNYQPISD